MDMLTLHAASKISAVHFNYLIKAVLTSISALCFKKNFKRIEKTTKKSSTCRKHKQGGSNEHQCSVF